MQVYICDVCRDLCTAHRPAGYLTSGADDDRPVCPTCWRVVEAELSLPLHERGRLLAAARKAWAPGGAR